MNEIRRYITASGKDVFGEWLANLNDNKTRAKILTRIDRLALGNFGDCKTLREGVMELRIDFGPGYRVYLAKVGKTVVPLLGGGDKHRQSADINRAVASLHDYQARNP
ncbi:MAG: type II toxin-antitoxin system RelE/ParE family toxin [Phycisphaeraceae bacterium]